MCPFYIVHSVSRFLSVLSAYVRDVIFDGLISAYCRLKIFCPFDHATKQAQELGLFLLLLFIAHYIVLSILSSRFTDSGVF